MGVELPLRVVVTILECCVTFSGVKLSIRSFVLLLRELEGLDKELRTISSSFRSAIAKSIAKQVDIDRENRKLEEMANGETNLSNKRINNEILG